MIYETNDAFFAAYFDERMFCRVFIGCEDINDFRGMYCMGGEL